MTQNLGWFQLSHALLDQMLQLPEGHRVVRVAPGGREDLCEVFVEGPLMPPFTPGDVIRQVKPILHAVDAPPVRYDLPSLGTPLP